MDATRKKVRAFFLVLVSTALRIGDVVALERGVVYGDKMYNRDYSFTDIARMEEQPEAMITGDGEGQ
jgi:hypothetical protein